MKDPCSFISVANVVVLEPWYQGSHRSWVKGWRSHSNHSIRLIDGTDAGWRRSLVTAPTRFAEAINGAAKPIDALVASTPIDLASVLGLIDRSTYRPPTLLYMHESQIGYPPGPKGGRPYRAMVNDLNSIMSADKVAVATQYHADLLRKGMPTFAEELVPGSGRKVQSKLEALHVLPVGIEVSGLSPASVSGPTRVLWNHRWSHDKNPGEFVHAMTLLAAEGYEFSLYALGEVERAGEKAHRRMTEQLSDRVLISGTQHRDTYRQILCNSDLVVSTAHHEFFGIAIAEAIAAGARPLIPDRLSYPEIVPREFSSEYLYSGPFDEALRATLPKSRDDLHINRRRTRECISAFAWEALAPKYDSLLDGLLADAS